MGRHLPGFLVWPRVVRVPTDLMEGIMGGSEDDDSEADSRFASCGELRSKRLVLRHPCARDAEAITVLANNPEISRWLARMPYPYERADAEGWIAANAAPGAGNCTYVITLAETGEVIGACGCEIMEECALPQVGYWIGQDHWGNGYAPEAVQTLIDHVFSTSNIETIGVGCRVANTASRRVIEKCGFQYCGLDMLESRFEGAVVPIFAFRLTRRTWQSLKSWAAA